MRIITSLMMLACPVFRWGERRLASLILAKPGLERLANRVSHHTVHRRVEFNCAAKDSTSRWK